MRTITTNLKYLFFGLVVFFALGLAHAGSYTLPSAAAPGSNVDVPLHTGPSQVKDGSLSVGTFAAYQDAVFSQQVLLNGTVFGGQPGNASSTLKVGIPGYATNISANGGVAVVGNIANGSVKSAALCADTNGTIVACAAPSTPHPVQQDALVMLTNDDRSGSVGMVAQITRAVSVPVTVETTLTYDTSMNTTLLDKLAAAYTANAIVASADNCPVPLTGEPITLTIPANSTISDRWSIAAGSCANGVIKVSLDSVSPTVDGSTTITPAGGILIIN
ncbi:MAG: hypothetical protein JWL92_249 [Candidatus Nomurabacteria bacterium]|nr:hypothetical protein [Candidatus Nomurabacteria bacterium]